MKYKLDNEQEVIKLKYSTDFAFATGDIVVHKKLLFHEMQGLLTKHISNTITLIPASPGTEVYGYNGYNTSVIKTI